MQRLPGAPRFRARKYLDFCRTARAGGGPTLICEKTVKPGLFLDLSPKTTVQEGPMEAGESS
jgi:hypothetical protein